MDPPQGGRIVSIVAFGGERLVSEVPRPSSCVRPDDPMAGRIKHGKFTFDGVDYEMPINHPPHAMHGTAYTSEWTTGPDTMRLELGEPWPFGGHVIHHASVDGATARFRLEVHAGDRPMPAMAGWHPWYRKPVELTFTAAQMYERDGRHPDRAPRRSPTWTVGRHVHRSRRAPRAAVAGRRRAHDHVELRPLRDLHAARSRAVCVEPQTGPPDGFNLGPQIVEPGTPLIADMTLAFTR